MSLSNRNIAGRKRRATNTFVNLSDNQSEAICHLCEPAGIIVKLVPYFMANGKEDKGFRRCPNCASAIDVRVTKHLSETGPLGSTNPKPASFESISPRRSRAMNRYDDVQKIPNFIGGREDSDLQALMNQDNRPAILTKVIDEEQDISEEQELDDYGNPVWNRYQ